MISLATTLSQKTLTAIQDRTGMKEIYGEDGGAYMILSSPMSPAPVGSLRMFSGDSVHKMVYIGLTVPPIGLDSHMIFAFTAPDSVVPHFTLDSVLAGEGHFAFHIDLIPRVDLGANLEYINTAFEPLTETFNQAREIEGLSAAHLSPRQYALMSPWMLAYRATEDAFAQIDTAVSSYLGHWFRLVEGGISVETTAADLSDRDTANRAAIFSPEVDPVWANVDRLVGEEVSAQLRAILIEQDVPA